MGRPVMPLRLRPAWMLSLIDWSWLCTAVIDTCDDWRAAWAAALRDWNAVAGVPVVEVPQMELMAERKLVAELALTEPVRPLGHVTAQVGVGLAEEFVQTADDPSL